MGNHDIWDELERAGTGERLSEEMFEFISAYADGECSAKERRLVEAYLSESDEARELLADLRSQAAMVGEGMADSPGWLRSSILGRTTERRVSRWPFAAGLAAASATAALLAVTYLPSDSPVSVAKDVLAINEPPQPDIREVVPESVTPPLPNTETKPEQVRDTQAQTESVRPPRVNRNEGSFRTVAAPTKEVEVTSPPPPVVAEETTDSERTTYAVVEYGSGRFQPKQPDPVDASATQSPETVKPAPRPEVLPDAREKLRDKVRKLNEEKLEVGGKENIGS